MTIKHRNSQQLQLSRKEENADAFPDRDTSSNTYPRLCWGKLALYRDRKLFLFCRNIRWRLLFAPIDFISKEETTIPYLILIIK
jgi:hypothetical protein